MARRRDNAARKIIDSDRRHRRGEIEYPRRPEEDPYYRVQQAQRAAAVRRKLILEQERQEERKRIRVEILENRAREKKMNNVFVFIVGVMMAMILLYGINFLKLKSDLRVLKDTIAAKQIELSHIKEENDAFYSEVQSELDLTRIKKIAIGRLGMKVPSEEQKMEYETTGGSYVRQYQEVPNLK